MTAATVDSASADLTKVTPVTINAKWILASTGEAVSEDYTPKAGDVLIQSVTVTANDGYVLDTSFAIYGFTKMSDGSFQFRFPAVH